MRVEVLYSPGCKVSKSLRNTLETVIAEEQLPIPVEMVESEEEDFTPPTVRIDGQEVSQASKLHPRDHFRDLLCGRWHELTASSFYGG